MVSLHFSILPTPYHGTKGPGAECPTRGPPAGCQHRHGFSSLSCLVRFQEHHLRRQLPSLMSSCAASTHLISSLCQPSNLWLTALSLDMLYLMRQQCTVSASSPHSILFCVFQPQEDKVPANTTSPFQLLSSSVPPSLCSGSLFHSDGSGWCNLRSPPAVTSGIPYLPHFLMGAWSSSASSWAPPSHLLPTVNG